MGRESGSQIGPFRARKDTRGVYRMVMLHILCVFRSLEYKTASCADAGILTETRPTNES